MSAQLPRQEILSLLTALQADPASAERRYQVAVALLSAGLVAQASAIAAPLLEAHPHHPVVATLAGDLHRARGDVAAAEAAYHRAVAADPDCAPAWNNLGNLLFARDRTAEAAVAYRAALRGWPAAPDVLSNLGRCLVEQGETEDGVALLARARDLSGAFRHRLAAARAVPVIVGRSDDRAAWSARVLAGLQALSADLEPSLASAAGRAEAVAAVADLFNVHYLGGPDRPLADVHGALLHRVMVAAYPGVSRHPAAGVPLPAARPGPVRVVFASECFQAHTVVKLFQGWIADLPSTQLRVEVVHLGQQADAVTARLGALHLGGSLDSAIAGLLALEADVIVWPDLGMGGRALRLAALGLAPRQFVGWGHPVATGLPTLDGVLSSAAMEPPDGADHYRAPLYRLPGLGVRPQRPEVAPAPLGRAGLGLPEGVPLALCAQSLFKLHPEDDVAFARILAAVPDAHLAVVRLPDATLTARAVARLQRTLREHGVAPARLHVLERQSPARWLALNRCADVFLDARHWSGGVTTLEALSVGLVPVTRWGHRMRDRHTAGILSELGVTDTIAGHLAGTPAQDADTDAAYVRLAARLLTDAPWRAALQQRLAAALPRLYTDPRPGHALAQILAPPAAVAQPSPLRLRRSAPTQHLGLP